MSIVDDMLTILRADAELTALLPGGMYSEPLSPKSPVTGTAWAAHSLTGVKRLRPSAVLLEPQEVDSPVGRNPGNRLDTDLWPELVFYAERADMAATFGPADERAMELLHGQWRGLAEIKATGFRTRPLEADELSGDVWTVFRRYRVHLVRHIATR
jgi:hypothetical protein